MAQNVREKNEENFSHISEEVLGIIANNYKNSPKCEQLFGYNRKTFHSSRKQILSLP